MVQASSAAAFSLENPPDNGVNFPTGGWLHTSVVDVLCGMINKAGPEEDDALEGGDSCHLEGWGIVVGSALAGQGGRPQLGQGSRPN
jgi:hypothetical protein